jgi:hypothetical protein
VLPAIAILIERAKNYPEEFIEGKLGKMGKWDDLINHFSPCMTQEERDALAAAMTEAKRTMFNEAVMKRLGGSDVGELSESALEEMTINIANSKGFGSKPKSILTMSQITEDSLKILEDQLKMEGSTYTRKYDVETDSYTLAKGKK